MTSIIEKLGTPPAVTTAEVLALDAEHELNWFDPKTRTAVPAQMEAVGYVRQGHPTNKGGRWVVGPKEARREIVIYVQAKLSKDDRAAAAMEVFTREQKRAPQKRSSGPDSDAGLFQ